MEGESFVNFDKSPFQNEQFPRFCPDQFKFPLFRSCSLPVYTAPAARRPVKFPLLTPQPTSIMNLCLFEHKGT